MNLKMHTSLSFVSFPSLPLCLVCFVRWAVRSGHLHRPNQLFNCSIPLLSMPSGYCNCDLLHRSSIVPLGPPPNSLDGLSMLHYSHLHSSQWLVSGVWHLVDDWQLWLVYTLRMYYQWKGAPIDYNFFFLLNYLALLAHWPLSSKGNVECRVLLLNV